MNPSYLDPDYYKKLAQYTGVSRWNPGGCHVVRHHRGDQRPGRQRQHGPAAGVVEDNGTVTHDWNPMTGAYDGYAYAYHYGFNSITIPWSSFTRSSWQPAGAPNDGFNRNQICAFSFSPAQAGAGSFREDQVEL